MDIDIHQLPIPDWGLHCPRCAYPLKHLTGHRCPECGKRLDMEEIVRAWVRLRAPRFDGHETPLPDFGLECEHCDSPLAGADDGRCPACGEEFDVDSFLPRAGDWFQLSETLHRGVPLPLVEAMLQTEQIPHLVRHSQTAFGVPTYQIWAPTEFYFELRYTLRAMRAEITTGAAVVRASWRCGECGERNPGTFEACWSCQASREADV